MQTLDHKMQNLMRKRHANTKSTLGIFLLIFEPYSLEWGLEFLLYLLAFMSNFLKTLTILKGRRPTQPWLLVKSITQGKPWYLVQLCGLAWPVGIKRGLFSIVASLGILVYCIIININSILNKKNWFNIIYCWFIC
jgi:hypothetical protein